MAGGRFELAMEPMAIGLVSLNSNSETHMTAICEGFMGGVDFTGIYMSCICHVVHINEGNLISLIWSVIVIQVLLK